MSLLRALLVSTANKWCRAQVDGDLATIASLRTPDTKYCQRPKSLNFPDRNNEEWDSYFKTTMGFFSKYDMEVNEIVVDQEERKVVMLNKTKGITHGGVPFESEFVVKLTMDHDGKKVLEHWVSIDSMYMANFLKQAGLTMPTEKP